MKVVQSSSQVSIVPSLSSSSHIFASSVSDRGNIIRRTASFSVSLYLNILQILRIHECVVRIDFGSVIELVSFDKSQVVTFNSKFIRGFRNNDCRTGSWCDNMVSSSHGFIIHWIEIFDNHEKVTEVVDVENWRIDNSRVLRWVVSLIERNSHVSSTKSSIQSTFKFR
ncbi:hypothetical protein Tco_1028193 [Tanacetum coccineum]